MGEESEEGRKLVNIFGKGGGEQKIVSLCRVSRCIIEDKSTARGSLLRQRRPDSEREKHWDEVILASFGFWQKNSANSCQDCFPPPSPLLSALTVHLPLI